MMRSSYEGQLDSPGGERRVVVRASSRSDACQMAAQAYPHCAFVVIGRVGHGSDPPPLAVAEGNGGDRR